MNDWALNEIAKKCMVREYDTNLISLPRDMTSKFIFCLLIQMIYSHKRFIGI